MENRVTVTLGNGCAVSDSFLIATGFPDTLSDGQKYTRQFYLNLEHENPWGFTDWPNHTVTSVCLRKPNGSIPRAACALSDEGYVQISNSHEERMERIPGSGLRDVETDYEIRGNVRGIQEIGSTLFVCGYYGQVYRRERHGWIQVSDDDGRRNGSAIDRLEYSPGSRNIMSVDALRQTAHLNSIDGVNEREAYTCGLSGHLYYLFGNSLERIAIDTSSHLIDIHSVSDRSTIVCGYHETLLIGNRRDGFRLLHESHSDLTFWSIRQFQGNIYVGTSQGLRRFNGTSFEVVRQDSVGFGEQTVIQQIDSVSDKYLWIVSDRNAYRYNGENIEIFEHPDNR